MAPVIWGLNLGEIQWYKFGHKYMFAGNYHLQTTKMIVYQLAMIFMVVSESIGTAALSDYVDQQDGIQSRTGFHTENNDIVGVLAYNIFVGIAVATIFGAGFFFDLFFPERVESRGVHRAWKISAVIVSLLALVDAIAITVIVATGNAYIRNVDKATEARLFSENGKPNPVYRKNAYCVASCVFCWIGMVSTFAATYVLFRSHAHDAKFGPLSKQGRATAGMPVEKVEAVDSNHSPSPAAPSSAPVEMNTPAGVSPQPNHHPASGV